MADSPTTPPPDAPSSRAPSSTSSPTFDVRPTASTQARWPGQRRKGRTTLAGAGAALGAGVVLLVLGPILQLPGFFFGAIVGLLGGVVLLAIGLIRYLKNGYAVPTIKMWQAVALSGGLPIFVAVALEGLAASAG